MRRASSQAVMPWKMGGEVPQTTSTFLTPSPIKNEETMNEMKAKTRLAKDLCSDELEAARITLTPPVSA